MTLQNIFNTLAACKEWRISLWWLVGTYTSEPTWGEIQSTLGQIELTSENSEKLVKFNIQACYHIMSSHYLLSNFSSVQFCYKTVLEQSHGGHFCDFWQRLPSVIAAMWSSWRLTQSWKYLVFIAGER